MLFKSADAIVLQIHENAHEKWRRETAVLRECRDLIPVSSLPEERKKTKG